MKAIVYYRVGNDRATRKTIEVEKNEPCSIVREFGILVPYIPCGGKRALQSILDAGGFCSFDGMEYVQEFGA